MLALERVARARRDRPRSRRRAAADLRRAPARAAAEHLARRARRAPRHRPVAGELAARDRDHARAADQDLVACARCSVGGLPASAISGRSPAQAVTHVRRAASWRRVEVARRAASSRYSTSSRATRGHRIGAVSRSWCRSCRGRRRSPSRRIAKIERRSSRAEEQQVAAPAGAPPERRCVRPSRGAAAAARAAILEPAHAPRPRVRRRSRRSARARGRSRPLSAAPRVDARGAAVLERDAGRPARGSARARRSPRGRAQVGEHEARVVGQVLAIDAGEAPIGRGRSSGSSRSSSAGAPVAGARRRARPRRASRRW